MSSRALPSVRVTDHCFAGCPWCEQSSGWDIERGVLRERLDAMTVGEPTPEALLVFGGEPTAHPEFLELLDDCLGHPRVPAVLLVTHGLRIAQDAELARALAKREVVLLLQITDAERAVARRDGVLDAIDEQGLTAVLQTLVHAGTSAAELRPLLELALHHPALSGLHIQPDPRRHIRPEVLTARLVEASDGRLFEDDFKGLDVAHRQCIRSTFLFELDDGSFVPLPRFSEPEAYRSMMLQHFITPDPLREAFLQHTIEHLWAHQDDIPRGEDIIQNVSRLLRALFDADGSGSSAERMRAFERRFKDLTFHNYLARDDESPEIIARCACHTLTAQGAVPECRFAAGHQRHHGIDGL